MPKLKTHSGAAKRFKKTGTGKFKRGQSKMRHILTSKKTKTKRHLRSITLVSEADSAKVARMIPYARDGNVEVGNHRVFKSSRSKEQRVSKCVAAPGRT